MLTALAFITIIVGIEMGVTAYVAYHEWRKEKMVFTTYRCRYVETVNYPQPYRDDGAGKMGLRCTYSIRCHVKGPGQLLCPKHECPLTAKEGE